jgi:rhamnose transport system ATP-binding protein
VTKPFWPSTNLSLDGVFEGIHFDLKRGEVLAMAGLIGARRTDVALALFGIQPATSGTVTYKGDPLKVTSPKQAMDAGIAYVSEDRRKLGLAMPMAIRANISLATLGDFLSKIRPDQPDQRSRNGAPFPSAA